MRGDNREKIIARWRGEFAELLKSHQASVAAHKGPGRNDEAADITRKMKDLQRAIKAYTETRQGEFARARQAEPATDPIRVMAGGHDVTDQMPRTAARLNAMRVSDDETSPSSRS